MQFMNIIASNDKDCVYGVYSIVTRSQHHTMRPATDIRYRPLLDTNPPSDPSTVKTAMVEY